MAAKVDKSVQTEETLNTEEEKNLEITPVKENHHRHKKKTEDNKKSQTIAMTKPKQLTKKQIQAEENRRRKEMEQIRQQLLEQQNEEKSKEQQRKEQAKLSKQVENEEDVMLEIEKQKAENYMEEIKLQQKQKLLEAQDKKKEKRKKKKEMKQTKKHIQLEAKKRLEEQSSSVKENCYTNDVTPETLLPLDNLEPLPKLEKTSPREKYQPLWNLPPRLAALRAGQNRVGGNLSKGRELQSTPDLSKNEVKICKENWSQASCTNSSPHENKENFPSQTTNRAGSSCVGSPLKAIEHDPELTSHHLHQYRELMLAQPERHTQCQLKGKAKVGLHKAELLRRQQEKEAKRNKEEMAEILKYQQQKQSVTEEESFHTGSSVHNRRSNGCGYISYSPEPLVNPWERRRQLLQELTPQSRDDEEKMLRQAMKRSLYLEQEELPRYSQLVTEVASENIPCGNEWEDTSSPTNAELSSFQASNGGPELWDMKTIGDQLIPNRDLDSSESDDGLPEGAFGRSKACPSYSSKPIKYWKVATSSQKKELSQNESYAKSKSLYTPVLRTNDRSSEHPNLAHKLHPTGAIINHNNQSSYGSQHSAEDNWDDSLDKNLETTWGQCYSKPVLVDFNGSSSRSSCIDPPSSEDIWNAGKNSNTKEHNHLPIHSKAVDFDVNFKDNHSRQASYSAPQTTESFWEDTPNYVSVCSQYKCYPESVNRDANESSSRDGQFPVSVTQNSEAFWDDEISVKSGPSVDVGSSSSLSGDAQADNNPICSRETDSFWDNPIHLNTLPTKSIPSVNHMNDGPVDQPAESQMQSVKYEEGDTMDQNYKLANTENQQDSVIIKSSTNSSDGERTKLPFSFQKNNWKNDTKLHVGVHDKPADARIDPVVIQDFNTGKDIIDVISLPKKENQYTEHSRFSVQYRIKPIIKQTTASEDWNSELLDDVGLTAQAGQTEIPRQGSAENQPVDCATMENINEPGMLNPAIIKSEPCVPREYDLIQGQNIKHVSERAQNIEDVTSKVQTGDDLESISEKIHRTSELWSKEEPFSEQMDESGDHKAVRASTPHMPFPQPGERTTPPQVLSLQEGDSTIPPQESFPQPGDRTTPPQVPSLQEGDSTIPPQESFPQPVDKTTASQMPFPQTGDKTTAPQMPASQPAIPNWSQFAGLLPVLPDDFSVYMQYLAQNAALTMMSSPMLPLTTGVPLGVPRFPVPALGQFPYSGNPVIPGYNPMLQQAMLLQLQQQQLLRQQQLQQQLSMMHEGQMQQETQKHENDGNTVKESGSYGELVSNKEDFGDSQEEPVTSGKSEFQDSITQGRISPEIPDKITSKTTAAEVLGEQTQQDHNTTSSSSERIKLRLPKTYRRARIRSSPSVSHSQLPAKKPPGLGDSFVSGKITPPFNAASVVPKLTEVPVMHPKPLTKSLEHSGQIRGMRFSSLGRGKPTHSKAFQSQTTAIRPKFQPPKPTPFSTRGESWDDELLEIGGSSKDLTAGMALHDGTTNGLPNLSKLPVPSKGGRMKVHVNPERKTLRENFTDNRPVTRDELNDSNKRSY